MQGNWVNSYNNTTPFDPTDTDEEPHYKYFPWRWQILIFFFKCAAYANQQQTNLNESHLS